MDRSLPNDLLELKARFDAWRRTRKSPRAKTPDDLLQAALAMLGHYPARLICRACRISSKTFARASASAAPPKKRQSTASFFKLPLETILKLKVAAKSCCYGIADSARNKRRYQSRAQAN